MCNNSKERGLIMKRIGLSALVLLGAWLLQGSKSFAQETYSQQPATATDNGPGAFLNQEMALMQKDIRSVEKQLIAANLSLTDAEATQFWPVYDEYARDLGNINNTRAALIQEYADNYGTLTDDQADSLIRRWLDTDIAAANLRQKYVPVVRKVLPGVKSATFFQLDRRISMMIDVQLTSHIPLAQGQE
jgi:hypothetical protein